MLAKVEGSHGKRRFYFAFAQGKRKDGKGDGALLVGANRIKADEAEADLEKCQQSFEGTCWSTPDGETVLFQGKGKKLSPMIVAKMALAAKKETSKQYDFRVPTDEEEAAATKLAEGEGGSEAQGVVPTGKVAAAVLRHEIHAIRMNAVRGLTELILKLKGDPDPRGKQVEPIVKQLALALPAELETVLQQL